VVTTRMGDCRRTGKLFRYIVNTEVNSAFHPSGGLVGLTCVGWQLTQCDSIWQVTLRSSVMGFLYEELCTSFTFSSPLLWCA